MASTYRDIEASPSNGARQRRFSAREIERIKKAGSYEAREKLRKKRSKRQRDAKDLHQILRFKKTGKTPTIDPKTPASPRGGEEERGALGSLGSSLPPQNTPKNVEMDQKFIKSNVEMTLMRQLMVRLINAQTAKLSLEDYKIWEIKNKTAKGVASCGIKGINDPVLVRYLNLDKETGEEISFGHTVFGAFGCGRFNFCVTCHLKHAVKHAENIKEVARRWLNTSLGRLVLFGTITMPSFPNRKYEETVELRKQVMLKTREGRQAKAFDESIGQVGYVACYENQFSENKVHSHEHRLIFIEDLNVPKSGEELLQYELDVSTKYCEYIEKNLRSIVAKARKLNPTIHDWIDLDAKEILKRPVIVEGRVKGGVTVELARNVEHVGNYLAKEVAYGLMKEGIGTDGKSYSWAGLLKNINTVPWAKRVLDEYINMQKHARTFSWSNITGKKGRKIGFNTYVLDEIAAPLDSKVIYKSLIIGMTSLVSMEHFAAEALRGNYVVEEILDKMQFDKNFDFEKASEGRIKKTPLDEASQQELNEKVKLAIKEYSKTMNDSRKKKKEEREKLSEIQIKQQIQADMARQKRYNEERKNRGNLS